MTISEAINRYKDNMKEADALTDALFTKEDKDEWIKALEVRAERLSNLYEEDNKLIDFIFNEIDKLEPENMDLVYDALYSLYNEGHDDSFVLIPILEKLEDYYRKNNNYEKLIVACSIHSYESHEYVSRIDPTVPFNIDLYKEVLKQKVHYSEIENPKVRADIFVGYFNVIVASESIPGISPMDSYNYLLEAEELYNSDEFKKVDSDNEDIKGMMEEIRQGFLVFAGRYNKLTDEIKDFIYERSLFYINKDDLYKSPLLPFLAYNRCLYEKGIITKDEILKRCDIYFKPMIEEFGKKEIVDEDIATAFEAMSLVLDILSLDGEADINHYYNLMKKFFRMADARKFAKITPYINSLLADFVLKSLPFEHNKEEIEQSLFDNLIKTQAPTYIHSVMVMKIAELIYNYMDKSLLPKLDNPHEFITNSALLHDIGKSKITAIINLQRRKLSSFEFTGIKNHPAFGIDIITKNKLLTEYHDVIIGHHKSYDGKSGYPKDFDNTKSEYKIIIDLITIADCLDAATDKYGRNYKHPKSVKDVILEFEAGSGTLYNPYFVDLLKNNKDLITKLEDLTELKRPEYMYKAYIKTGIFD